MATNQTSAELFTDAVVRMFFIENDSRNKTGREVNPLQKESSKRLRWPLAIGLAALILLLLWLFPQGDEVADVAFNATGFVQSTVEEENRIAQIRFLPEGSEESQAVDLALHCKVVNGNGKFSAHRLPGQQVRLHFVGEGQRIHPERETADLIFVLPS